MISWTEFADKYATTKTDVSGSFDAFCDALEALPSAPSKDRCKLVKLARFGEAANDRGCLRTNENMLAIAGVELDYDLEEMSLDEAAELFEGRGIAALFYTSPSHTAERPRWRVILPFSRELTPDQRDTYVSRGNGVLGGVVSDESFNWSQAFYAGRVDGVPYQSRRVSGRCIDEVAGLPEIGRRGPGANGASGYTLEHAYDDIRAGLNMHGAINHAAMCGESKAQIEAVMLESVAKEEDPGRWAKRLAEIDRSIRGAVRRKTRDIDRRVAQMPAPPMPVAQKLAGGLPIILPAEFASLPLRRRLWIAEPLIPAGETTLLYGAGAAGKSLLLLQLCLGMAGGIHWLGKPIQAGRALLFTCEDDADEINRRAVKVLKALGITWRDCGDRFAVVPMRASEASAVLAAPGKDGTLVPTATYEALKKAVADFKPDLTIIDTLADVHAGNENDRAHAKQFIKLVERLGQSTFIVTAHPSVSGQADGRGASGSTGWPAAVRSHLYLERVRGEEGAEADPDLRRLSNLKANYSQAAAGGIEMRWVEGVFQPTDAAGVAADMDAKADEFFLTMLARYNSEGRGVNGSSGATYAPRVFADDAMAKEARMNKRTLKAAMDRLFAAKRMRIEHGHRLRVCVRQKRPSATA